MVAVAASLLLTFGLLVSLACSNTDDEQRGNIGQLCFVNTESPCNPGLICVPLPLEGGGFDGGECFDLSEGGEDGAAEDALTDAGAPDGLAADSADAEQADGGGVDAAEGEPAPEAGVDGETE